MDLVVHPDAATGLKRLRRDVPHAVVLVGSMGVGKSLLARQTAVDVLDTTEPLLVNNPYFTEVIPIKGTITIEQIRNLIQFFNLSVPGNANVKRVALIIDAESMGIEAQNALLKLLEEPPVGSLLLLTSSRPLGLLPTIRSRVQQVHIIDPLPYAIVEHFVSLGSTAADVEKSIIRHGSNMAELQAALIDKTGASDDVVDTAKRILQGTQFERLILVDGLAKQKDQAYAVVETLAAIAVASLNTAAHKHATSLSRWQSVLVAANIAQESLDRNGSTKLVLTELMLSL